MTTPGGKGNRCPCLVVGYDGSQPARAALAYAIARARPGGRVIAVYGFDPPPDWLGAPDYQRILDDHAAHGRAVLDGILLEGNDEVLDVEFETELMGESPPEAILRVANVRGADEIVVGSRGFGRVRAMLGSTSHELLHLADRPVLVIPDAYVREQPEALRRAPTA